MSVMDDLKRVPWGIIALLLAFCVGVWLGVWGKGKFLVPDVQFGPAPGIIRPMLQPTGKPTPAPAASKGPDTQATTRTRVVIERPIIWTEQSRPGATDPTQTAPRPANSAVQGPTGPNSPDNAHYHASDPAPSPPSPGAFAMERIIIETDAGATASAPAPQKTEDMSIDTTTPIGVTVGTFPGNVALDVQIGAVSAFGLSAGPAILVNHKMIGLGGALSFVALSPHLYVSTGVSQPYQLIPDPQPYIGAGWRF